MRNLLQVDSLKTITDTTTVAPAAVEVYDAVKQNTEAKQVSAPKIEQQLSITKVSQSKQIQLIQSIEEPIIINSDTTNTIIPEAYQAFLPYTSLNSCDSSKFKQSAQIIKSFQSNATTQYTSAQIRNNVRVFEKEWILGVAFFIVILLIIVRSIFQKQLTSIFASLINIRAADKLLREKNLALHRAFFLLNITYMLTLGLYFFQLSKRMNLQLTIENDFFLFLFILLVLITVTVFRLIIAKFIAFIFDATAVFKEYLHNSFIISKNLGLYLFPIIISIVFVDKQIGEYLFVLASIIIVLSLLLRYLKGIQIILKHNIFLFYSIVYLCTLEILPVLIGIKIIFEM